MSTVWIRDIGATRHSWLIQPAAVYTASSVVSHRCTRNRHRGITSRYTTPMAATAMVLGISHGRACAHSAEPTPSVMRTPPTSRAAWAVHQAIARELTR